MTRAGYIVIALLVVAGGAALILGRADSGTSEEVHTAAAIGEDTLVVPGLPPSVAGFLASGQSWRAARVLRQHLEGEEDAPPEAYLLAARAEAGWGGWDRVREYLEGEAWLDSVRRGEGWYWLGRALEAEERWDDAFAAYSRFLSLSGEAEPGDRRRVAELRQGLILLRLGRTAEGAALLARMREHAPDIAPRIDVLAAEALSVRGDTAGVRELVGSATGRALVRRGRVALLDAYQRAPDPAGALALARSYRQLSDSEAERALFGLSAARLALARSDTASARADLRRILAETPGAASAREAAELLASLPGLQPADQLTLATVLDRHGANAEAARFYRSWLALEQGTADERLEMRRRMGRALFDAGSFAGAIAALAPVAGAPGQRGAEAMLYTGRAESRLGQAARSRATFLSLATRHRGSEEGSEGLFLVADLAHDARDYATAGRLYQRLVDEFPGTDRSGLAMMRLGGMAYLAKDYARAARIWEQYRATYPSGERWLESTYWAARSLEQAGDATGAAERYRAIRARSEISYYAVRAAERLKEPYWPVPMGESPAEDPAAGARVEEWMHGVDLLREAGLYAEAEAEAEGRIELAGDDPALLYPLAETLNERGYTVQGIRIGLRLQQMADRPNLRVLRIVYPFPYREMIEAEAIEKRLDPFMVAALIRQESTFKARISSPVGARGLMQVMPETGRALASGARIQNWDAELLFQPEINTHLGTRFLADQMRAFDGSLPSVFAAYNAGPHRVERWSRFPEYPDEELFTERIPYRETRDYVKILTRNAAIYRGLYQ